MIRVVNEARDSEFEQRASEYFDLNRLATYLAVDSFLAQADGFLGDWGVNNIYLYQFENQKRWTFLPWDEDLAFYDTQFEIFRHVDANVLASRLLALPGARKTYLDTLLACASLAMTPESQGSTMGWFEAELQAGGGPDQGGVDRRPAQALPGQRRRGHHHPADCLRQGSWPLRDQRGEQGQGRAGRGEAVMTRLAAAAVAVVAA